MVSRSCNGVMSRVSVVENGPVATIAVNPDPTEEKEREYNIVYRVVEYLINLQQCFETG